MNTSGGVTTILMYSYIYILTSIVKFLTLATVHVMGILDKALALGNNNHIEAYFTIWSFSLAFSD